MRREILSIAVCAAGLVLTLCFVLLGLSPRFWTALFLAGHLPEQFWSPERISRARYVGFSFGAVWALYAFYCLRRRGRERRLARAGESSLVSLIRSNPSYLVAVLVLFIASFLVRVRFLSVPLDYDEAYTFWNYARHGPLEAIARFDSTNNHPLNSLLMSVCYELMGAHEWVIRLPVFLAGVLVPVLVFLACAVFGEAAVGFCAGTVAVLSMPLVEYSVNARGYMLLAAANLLATLGAARVGRGHRVPGLIRTGMVLGFWSLPSALLAFPGMLAWIWRRTRSLVDVWQTVLGVVAVGGLIYVPGYIAMGTRALENPFVLPLDVHLWLVRYPLGLIEALGAAIVPVPYDGIAARMQEADLAALSDWLTHPEAVGSLAVAALLVGTAVWARGELGSWLVAVLASVAVACAVLRLAPPPRVLAPYIPMALVLSALGGARIVRRAYAAQGERHAHLKKTALVAALVLLGLGLGFYWSRPLASRFDRYGWRLYVPVVSERIAERSGRRECCIVASLPVDLPVRFYLWRRGVPFRWGLDGQCAGGQYLLWLGPEDASVMALVADPVLRPYARRISRMRMQSLGYFGPMVLYELHDRAGSAPVQRGRRETRARVPAKPQVR